MRNVLLWCSFSKRAKARPRSNQPLTPCVTPSILHRAPDTPKRPLLPLLHRLPPVNTGAVSKRRNKGDVRGQRRRYWLRNPSRRRAYWRTYRAQRRASFEFYSASVAGRG